MKRLNRTWMGLFLISLGRRILPARIRGEWDLQFKRKTVEVAPVHDVDLSRFYMD